MPRDRSVPGSATRRNVSPAPGTETDANSSGVAGIPALVLVAVGLTALAARALPALSGGGLGGVQGYDDGVYFAAASALTQGVVPYRDFVLLHPPGIVLALSPFAAVDAVLAEPVGFVVARVVFMALGAASAMLIAVIAGRHGRSAGVLAGLVYAVWAAPAAAERRADLLALENLLLLVALLALDDSGRIGRRRAAIAGAALGVAVSVHLWQGLSAAVLLSWLLVRGGDRELRSRVRSAAPFVVAAAAAFAAVITPFALVAPEEMIRYVLLDQLGRPDMGIQAIERLRILEGLPRDGAIPGLGKLPGWVSIAAAAVGLGVLAATAWRLPWTRPWASLAVAQSLVVFATPSFHDDYAAFPAPAAALVLGTGVAAGVGALHRRVRMANVAWVPLGAVLAVMAARTIVPPVGRAVPIAEVRATIAGARCVATDTPALLVQTTAMRSNVTNGCPTIVDPTGVFYDIGGGNPSRYRSPEYQQAMIAWFTRSDAALLTGRGNLARETVAAIRKALPFEVAAGRVTILLAQPPP